jgi:hypothetical protein
VSPGLYFRGGNTGFRGGDLCHQVAQTGFIARPVARDPKRDNKAYKMEVNNEALE